MFHGYDYPDETGKDELAVRLWRPKMIDGIIKFPMPKDCDPAMRRFIRKMTAKKFEKGLNFSFVDDDLSVAVLLEEE